MGINIPWYQINIPQLLLIIIISKQLDTTLCRTVVVSKEYEDEQTARQRNYSSGMINKLNGSRFLRACSHQIAIELPKLAMQVCTEPKT